MECWRYPPKFIEIPDLLLNSTINFIAAQESKLRKPDINFLESKLRKPDKTWQKLWHHTFVAKGCTTIQKDHNNILRGGLLFLIWTEIIFEKLHSFEKADKKILSFRLLTNKLTWLELYNVYLLSATAQQIFFNPSIIKPTPTSVILSKFNGYSQTWDPLQSTGSRVDEILDRILDNDLNILSYGSATRTSCITRKYSFPDISLCGQWRYLGISRTYW